MKNNLNRKFTYFSLLRFVSPTIVMMVFMSFYQLTDGIFISNFVGAEALSSTNVFWPIISLMNAVSILLASGGSALVSRKMGQNKYEEARSIFTMIIVIAILYGAFMSVVILMFMDPMFSFLGMTPVLYPYGVEYMSVIGVFATLWILQILLQTYFVAAGKSHIGLILTLLAGVTNVVLDYVFMGVLQIGVSGAAWGTVCGQSILVIFGLLYFLFQRKGTLYFTKFHWKWDTLKRIASNGSSEMVSNLSYSVTTYLFNVSILMFMDEQGIAALTIILYAQYVLSSLFFGFSSGVAPIFSYQYGKGDNQQIRKLFKMSLRILFVFSLFIFVVSKVFATPLINVFTPIESTVFQISLDGFTLFSLSFLLCGFNIFTSSLFTALSNGKVSALLSFLRTGVFIVCSLLILPRVIGINGIWLAIPCAEVLSLGVSIYVIKKHKGTYKYC